MANVYRADQAGILVAPNAAPAGSVDAQAVKSLLALQKECGIDVLTDGQVLRASPCAIFVGNVAGVRSDPEGKGPSCPHVAGPLERQARLTAAEVAILQGAATGPFKICLPAPSVAATQMFREGVTDAHYPTRRDLAAALAAILRAEIQDLIAEGVPYIQLDGPAYELAADPIAGSDFGRREAPAPKGRGPEWAEQRAGAARLGNVDEMLRLDAEALKELRKPEKCALALRLPLARDPRGVASAAAGLSERRAAMLESALTRMPVERFLIEFGAEPTEADFAPLRAVPAGKMAVLGLVDPLAARAGEVDPLLDKLDLAVSSIGAERLALSPRRGFGEPGIANDPKAFEAQRRSLTLTVEAARRFWGFEM